MLFVKASGSDEQPSSFVMKGTHEIDAASHLSDSVFLPNLSFLLVKWGIRSCGGTSAFAQCKVGYNGHS